MLLDPSARFRLETAVFFLAVLCFCGAGTYWQWFRTLDLTLYDTLISAYSTPLAENLIIVGIDEQSLSNYGAWPWPRTLQARVIRKINQGSPRALLVDIVYGGVTDPLEDQALADAAAEVETLALPVMIDALATNRQLVEVLPYPDLLDTADVLGHIHVELDSDAIVRGVYLRQGVGDAFWPHLAVGLAQFLDHEVGSSDDCPSADDFTIQNQRCRFVYTTFAGPPGSVPEISVLDLLEERVDHSALNGKVVFLGMTTVGAADSVTSPVSGNDRPMPGVEFNANLYNSLIQGRVISSSPLALLLPIALLCAVAPVLLLPRLKPKAMLIATTGFACVPVIVTVLILLIFNLQMPLAVATVTCLLSYPYWSWRRHEIAWQFVNAEMLRLAVEKSRWVLSENLSQTTAVETLRDLLRADASWQETAPEGERNDQVSLPDDNGRYLVMSRAEPFTATERALVAKVQPVFGTRTPNTRLPGEVLAAQIRRLQAAAREVRLGREVGLRGLAEMPNGVAVLSVLNQVLFANQACRQLLNLTPDIEGLDLATLVRGLVPPLGSSWREISRSIILDQKTVTFETQTAASVPVVVEAAPLADPGETPESWVITVTNVADVHSAEKDREEALAFLSHDLRSPMLSVLALVRSARETPLLRDIGRYAQKALSVSEQFLQLSRVQAREIFETYDLDLVIVIDNAIDDIYPMAQEKGSTVRFEQPPDSESEEGAWIEGNGELLERAFVNLLSNATKYGATGEQIEVSLTESADVYTVDVTDHGAGIPEDELAHVFDPYFRAKEPALAEQRGAGLGLRFVKTVVERHGGNIEVTSCPGEGSTFSVTLPRAVTAEIPQPPTT